MKKLEFHKLYKNGNGMPLKYMFMTTFGNRNGNSQFYEYFEISFIKQNQCTGITKFLKQQ